jgi:hypothetical protein
LPQVTLADADLPLARNGGVIELEFDRMTGTAFPVVQDRAGKRHDLRSIYLDGAGIVLVVREDETNITPLSDPLFDSFDGHRESITAAELDNLARAHRRLPVAPATAQCTSAGGQPPTLCTRYFLYGVVVDHLFEDERGPQPGTLGVMWDTSNRSQFAMFYRNAIVRSDGGKYLRSVAHEIGHAFNLHHEDGDGVSSIINQTKIVGDKYTYDFSAAEKAHLREHTPQRCARPGAGSFASVDAVHSVHRGSKADCK